MGGVLDGLRVVDFGQYLAGPEAAMMLGDLGAQVIRVDPPGGPRWHHPVNALLQRGKQSIVLNVKRSEDHRKAQRLIERADVVIEGFRPGVMDRLDLGADWALSANPRLIYCSLPGFGAADPRARLPGWEGVVSAAAGLYLPRGASPMNYRGIAGADPVYNALPMASSFAAMIAGHSILAALIVRERTGLGQRVEVPLFDAAFELIGHAAQGAPRLPPGMPAAFAPPPHMGHYRCADGRWIYLCLIQDRHLQWFAQTFMPQEWIEDGMADPDRLRGDAELQKLARERFTRMFQTRPALEWERAINEQSGAPTSTCATSAEWLRTDEHGRAIAAVIELDDPEYGHTNQAGYPIRMSKTPPAAQGPRHRLNADREAILADLGADRPAASEAEEKREDVRQALAGIRVVDLTQVLAGPTSARILAEYGAEVIKINSAQDRQLGMHFYTNSGKRTLLLNVKTPEGMRILWQFVEQADVFVQNFTRGVAERMGIGEADVRQHNPEIIYSSLSAFGYEGWRGGYRGREELGQAPTGIQTRWGGDGEPMMYPQALCDYGAGNFAAFATLAALYHRMRTGEGQHVHASLIHTATYHQLPYMLDCEGRNWDEPGGQEAKGWGPLDRLYPAADRWFYLAALADADREQLAQVEGLAGIEHLSGTDLEEALEARFATAPAVVWVERLSTLGMGAHVLMDYDEVMEVADVKARGLSIVREHPQAGPIRLVGPSRRLFLTPPQATFPAGPPGYDSRAVVGALQLSEPFDALVEKGVVAEGLPEGVAFVGQFR